MAGKTVPQEQAVERWEAVRNADGNVSEAARVLGMQRQRLSNWLQRHPAPGEVVPPSKDGHSRAKARRGKNLHATERIHTEAMRVEDLTPTEIFRKFFESYDLLARELNVEVDKATQLEAEVKALKEENIRLRGQLSYYEDKEKVEQDQMRSEMRRRIEELNQPGD